MEEIYGWLLGQWVLEMNHVGAIVGGLQSQQKVAGQDGTRFTPISRQRQQQAVQFLSENAFTTPAFVIKPEILRRIEPNGVLGRIRTSQQRVLASLVSAPRIARLVEHEALDGATAYRPSDFLADVRRGIWRELDAESVRIDPYRRNLQRAYLDLMSDKVNGRGTADEGRPLARGELRTLQQSVRVALAKVTDRETRFHLEDVRDQIVKILDPKFAPPAAPAAGPILVLGFDGVDSDRCWPDYVIRADSIMR